MQVRFIACRDKDLNAVGVKKKTLLFVRGFAIFQDAQRLLCVLGEDILDAWSSNVSKGSPGLRLRWS